MKTENTVTWLTITWYWELFKDKNENIVQARDGHTSEWGKKKGMKRVSSDAKKGKKHEIWYFSQVAKVCLFKAVSKQLQINNYNLM